MVVSKRWQLGAMCLAGWVAVGGCSDSKASNGSDAGGDDGGASSGDGSSGNGSGNGNGNGNGNSGDNGAQLEGEVAGMACADDSDCPGENTACLDSFSPVGNLDDLVDLGSTPAPGGYCSGRCTEDSQCGEGGACAGAVDLLLTQFDGLCQQACEKDGDCREGYVCTRATENIEELRQAIEDSGAAEDMTISSLLEAFFTLTDFPTTCQAVPKPASLNDGVAGKACDEDAACGGEGGTCLTTTGTGLFGEETTFEGGYCSGTCTESAQCGEGGVCLEAFNRVLPGRCYQACAGDDDCSRDGYRCMPLVLGDTEGDRRCYPAADPLPDNTAGTPCTEDADCGHGTCSGFVEGGSCTIQCVQDSDCGVGGACAFTLGGFCAEACEGDEDCTREGYTCVAQGEGDMAASSYCSAPASEPEPDAGAGDADAGTDAGSEDTDAGTDAG